MTKGRIYVTVTADGKLKAVTRYDKNNKRYKQIDLIETEHIVSGEKSLPHSHLGYWHDEHGTKALSKRDQRLIDKVTEIWDTKNSRQ